LHPGAKGEAPCDVLVISKRCFCQRSEGALKEVNQIESLIQREKSCGQSYLFSVSFEAGARVRLMDIQAFCDSDLKRQRWIVPRRTLPLSISAQNRETTKPTKFKLPGRDHVESGDIQKQKLSRKATQNQLRNWNRNLGSGLADPTDKNKPIRRRDRSRYEGQEEAKWIRRLAQKSRQSRFERKDRSDPGN
jgi:hypothetical protein